MPELTTKKVSFFEKIDKVVNLSQNRIITLTLARTTIPSHSNLHPHQTCPPPSPNHGKTQAAHTISEIPIPPPYPWDDQYSFVPDPRGWMEIPTGLGFYGGRTDIGVQHRYAQPKNFAKKNLELLARGIAPGSEQARQEMGELEMEYGGTIGLMMA